ncbi:MAG: hypothetical protein N0E37_07500 [Candidatus Thiodiazotropha taylori]|nr:hypothetical protein [Candidatus Thiodiazotropha taylori]MCG7895939.1 hypothetical protein [Candidatus Thiodiazotropha taylori]MCG7909279.1 hypothetical protein [Candidatus Thiodiazotropha taylori]MCG7917584.1 hypothetical protein [Candidatus Thiodiazotropha taylori]MCG7942816.1 hypothetical protein [Candidatus Thiodiazotropha taylori]
MSSGKRSLQKRIAYEAAKILTELRTDNLAYACRKAAAKHGVTKQQLMPSRDEIEQALKEQQRLVLGDKQHTALNQLRESALDAMQALKQFQPLLVGPVLQGTADDNSHIELHLQADTPEEVLFALSDLHIPWQEKQRQLNFSDGSHETIPCFRFSADEIQYLLMVFPNGKNRKRPLDPFDHKPFQSANIKQLKALLDEEHSAGSDYYEEAFPLSRETSRG